MTIDQIIVFTVLCGTLVLFVWGKLRYDIVSMLALTLLVMAGIVPAQGAFDGFGHPAVATVAAVLALTKALQNSGVVDQIGRSIEPLTKSKSGRLFTLTGLVSVASGFMNNIAACALFMPIAIQTASLRGDKASNLLMPISFASLLGGLFTLIGTPPNVIVAVIRGDVQGEPFHMFDFTPVGFGIAVLGVFYLSFIGWRWLPHNRDGRSEVADLVKIENYISEAKIPADSPLSGATLRELEAMADSDVAVVTLVRGDRRILAPSLSERLRNDDVLILEGNPAAIQELIDRAGLDYGDTQRFSQEMLKSEEVGLIEVVIAPGSRMEGRSARNLLLHAQYGVNLLAVARQGRAVSERIGTVRFEVGDVLLLQGKKEHLPEALSGLNLLPLAERPPRSIRRGDMRLTLGIFGLAIASTAFGLFPIQVSFLGAVVAMILAGSMTPRELYDSVEWPIIILLGTMIPVGEALQATGGTALISHQIILLADMVPVVVLLGVIILITMLISDVMNNAATAVLMAPVAADMAQGLGFSPDPFLMAVAIGASCTFLTPIGHQSNLLVMGPGGYRFGDYWRLGLPLDILILLAAPWLILWVWPVMPT